MGSRVDGNAGRQSRYRKGSEDTARKPGRRKRNNARSAKNHTKKIKASLQFVKRATGEKGATIDATTKANEQELFATMMHKRLAAKDPELGGKFKKYFKRALEQVKDNDKSEPVFRAARRAMRKLVKTDELVKQELAVKIRRFAAGKAQLDDDKKHVLVDALSEVDAEPSKTLEEALLMVKSNSRLSKSEHTDFKSSMNDLLRGDKTHECDPPQAVVENEEPEHICDEPVIPPNEKPVDGIDTHDCDKVGDIFDSEATDEIEAGCCDEDCLEPVVDSNSSTEAVNDSEPGDSSDEGPAKSGEAHC